MVILKIQNKCLPDSWNGSIYPSDSLLNTGNLTVAIFNAINRLSFVREGCRYSSSKLKKTISIINSVYLSIKQRGL